MINYVRTILLYLKYTSNQIYSLAQNTIEIPVINAASFPRVTNPSRMHLEYLYTAIVMRTQANI